MQSLNEDPTIKRIRNQYRIVGPDTTPSLLHWKRIVGDKEDWLKAFLLSWYKSPFNPHGWNEFYAKQSPETKQIWEILLNRCLDNGWYWPKVIDNRLTFGSRFPPHEQPRYDEWDSVEDAYDDFVHEE